MTEVPLLRFHHYVFSVQVSTNEHNSKWSNSSDPLHLMLPEVLPPSPAEAVAKFEESDEFLKEQIEDALQKQCDRGEPEEEEDPHDAEKNLLSPSKETPHPEDKQSTIPIPLDLLDAEVHCPDKDSSSWFVELCWKSFPLSEDGAKAFPPLTSLPVEFQISYFVLSERPCSGRVALI